MRGIYMNNDNFLSKLTEYIKTKLNGGNDNNKNNNSKKPDKLLGNLILMILVAVVIVLASSFFKTPKATSTAATSEIQKDKIVKDNNSIQFSDYESQLENKLKSTLEGIQGVGRVQLMINFGSGEESIPAVNINDSELLTKEKDTQGGERITTQKNEGKTVVMTNNGNTNEPLIVKKYKPAITGVCVVAEGAKERITELRIRQAVINLFNLPENKVNVYPMNN
jgi:stage III sporulation protein AG